MCSYASEIRFAIKLNVLRMKYINVYSYVIQTQFIYIELIPVNMFFFLLNLIKYIILSNYYQLINNVGNYYDLYNFLILQNLKSNLDITVLMFRDNIISDS